MVFFFPTLFLTFRPPRCREVRAPAAKRGSLARGKGGTRVRRRGGNRRPRRVRLGRAGFAATAQRRSPEAAQVISSSQCFSVEDLGMGFPGRGSHSEKFELFSVFIKASCCAVCRFDNQMASPCSRYRARLRSTSRGSKFTGFTRNPASKG